MFPRTVKAALHLNEIVDSVSHVIHRCFQPYAFYASERVPQHVHLQGQNIITDPSLNPTPLVTVVMPV